MFNKIGSKEFPRVQTMNVHGQMYDRSRLSNKVNNCTIINNRDKRILYEAHKIWDLKIA